MELTSEVTGVTRLIYNTFIYDPKIKLILECGPDKFEEFSSLSLPWVVLVNNRIF